MNKRAAAAERRAYIVEMLRKYVPSGLTFDQIVARVDADGTFIAARRTIQNDLAVVGAKLNHGTWRAP